MKKTQHFKQTLVLDFENQSNAHMNIEGSDLGCSQISVKEEASLLSPSYFGKEDLLKTKVIPGNMMGSSRDSSKTER